MSLPGARLGDPTMHGGVVVVGMPTVMIGGKPAARIGDMHTCPMVTGVVPHVGGPVCIGAFTVLIGGMPAARQTDMAVCVGPPDTIAMGAPTVLIGMAGAGGALGILKGLAMAGMAMLTRFAGGGYPRAVPPVDASGNPILDGSYVTEYSPEITVEGTTQFQADVIRDLDVLNSSDAGKRLIDSFNGTGQKVTVRQTNAPNGGCAPDNGTDAVNGKGTDSVVTYNPSFGSMYDSGPTAKGQPGREPWMDTTPPVILGHELTHAHHNAHGTNDFTIEGERMAVGTPSQPGYPTDHSARDISENAVRDDLGQPRRPRYNQVAPP